MQQQTGKQEIKANPRTIKEAIAALERTPFPSKCGMIFDPWAAQRDRNIARLKELLPKQQV